MSTGSSIEGPTLFFTYAHPVDADLQQGDILKRTPGIKSILERFHPYYCEHDSYTHFIVLTQSCDLVRRNGQHPKSRYITLAAIRPMSLVVERELEKYQSDLAKRAMVCKDSVRDKLSHFVEQVLNNNASDFFYLHPQPELGFSEPSCAFLRLSVSLKSVEHYQTCYAARLLSLAPVFQTKLGWLVGNMYSRVGTDDWIPKAATPDQFSQKIKDILDELCDFVDAKKLRIAEKSASPDFSTKSKQEIREYIKNTKVPQRREEILTAVEEVLLEMGKITTAEEAHQLKMWLSANPRFKEFTK